MGHLTPGSWPTLGVQRFAPHNARQNRNVRPHWAPMAPLPPELRRYRLIVVASSLLLAAAGSIALLVILAPDPAPRPAIPLVLFAVVALAVTAYGLFFVPRWYHRAAYVISTSAPLSSVATLTLETDTESTSLYAAVSTAEASAQPLDRIALLMPRWDVRRFLDAPLAVDLYIDLSSSRLVAISSKHGVLWCMPSGHVVRNRS
jgi:hypothetical protein